MPFAVWHSLTVTHIQGSRVAFFPITWRHRNQSECRASTRVVPVSVLVSFGNFWNLKPENELGGKSHQRSVQGFFFSAVHHVPCPVGFFLQKCTLKLLPIPICRLPQTWVNRVTLGLATPNVQQCPSVCGGRNLHPLRHPPPLCEDTRCETKEKASAEVTVFTEFVNPAVYDITYICPNNSTPNKIRVGQMTRDKGLMTRLKMFQNLRVQNCIFWNAGRLTS